MPSLGNSQLGTEYLAGTVTLVNVKPTSSETDTRKFDGEKTAITSTKSVSAVTGTKAISSVSLSPENLSIRFNESAGEFQSNWFTKETPLEETGELVIVGTFRREQDEPVDIVVERDDGGDGLPDITSEIQTLNDENHILTISEGDRGEDIAKKGARYRLRFPNYTQSDAIERLTLALGWNNEREFQGQWQLDSVDTKEQPTNALIAVLISENYRLDSTLDEVFKQQHIESSTDSSLDLLSKEVGAERKSRENDEHLRKRTLSKSATQTFSTTGSDVSDLVGLIFDERGEEISLGVLKNEPVLTVEVPQTVMDAHILSQTEVENLLNDGVASSYNVSITKI